MNENFDEKTIESFGDEWTNYDQGQVATEELSAFFEDYFRIFPWETLPDNAEGFDLGCGSGRWAQFVAPKVSQLNCIEPSRAIESARNLLEHFKNVRFLQARLDEVNLEPHSQDFGYCLGVLHHLPKTEQAVKDCAALLKPGAPFLMYLYYAFDDRPLWFRMIWRASDLVRRFICRLPPRTKGFATDLIAYLVYYPLSRFSSCLEYLGISSRNVPLSYYQGRSVKTLRTDARDRFGTPIEHRFARGQIEQMMLEAGFEKITFSEGPPYWCVVGRKSS